MAEYFTGAAFSLSKSFMNLTTSPDKNNQKQNRKIPLTYAKKQREGSQTSRKVENPIYGPFEEQMREEKRDFVLFEAYLTTLH